MLHFGDRMKDVDRLGELRDELLEIFVNRNSEAAANAVDAVQDGLLEAIEAPDSETRVKTLAFLEELLIGLLGCRHMYCCDRAVVLLNVLYDGHDWQLLSPLPVQVACVGEPFAVGVHCLHESGSGEADTETRKHDLALLSQMSTRNLVLRLVGPPPGELSQNDEDALMALPEGASYVRRMGHVIIDFPVKLENGAFLVSFGSFRVPGYYDWRIGSRCHSSGGECILDLEDLPVSTVMKAKLRGRFIVHPAVRDALINEIFVEQCGALWDVQTGQVTQRGSFKAVNNSLAECEARGYTHVYLSFALQRDHGARQERPEASPLAVTDRTVPNFLLGGPEEFKSLMKGAHDRELAVLVDLFSSVSASRAHRRYRHSVVHCLDKNGALLRHASTDGVGTTWDEGILLNYRRLETWDMLFADLEVLIDKYGIDGVRVENAQSLPLIMEPDVQELDRRDVDGCMAYSVEERFFGEVVVCNKEYGYWRSDACEEGYPNPLLVKLTRHIWRRHPQFLFTAECHFGREFDLVVSGVVPHSRRLTETLAGIYGKIVHKNGDVTVKPKPLTAIALADLYRSERTSLPKGACLLQCICTHWTPYPCILFGRGAWSAVDALFFLPDIPIVLYGEAEGYAHRPNTSRVMSFKPDLPSTLVPQPIRRKKPKKQKKSITRDSSVESLQSLDAGSDVRQSSGERLAVKSLSHEDLRSLDSENKRVYDELGPDYGFDIHQIRLHYEHRRDLRESCKSLREGHMVVLECEAKVRDSVFSFSRFTSDEVVLVALNLSEDEVHTRLDLRALAQRILLEDPDVDTKMYMLDNLMTGKPHEEVTTPEELVYRPLAVKIGPQTAICLKLVEVDRTPETEARHAKHSLARLQADMRYMVDPRANSLIADLTRSLTSIDLFATTLLRLSNALSSRVVSTDINKVLTLRRCVQRAACRDDIETHRSVKALSLAANPTDAIAQPSGKFIAFDVESGAGRQSERAFAYLLELAVRGAPEIKGLAQQLLNFTTMSMGPIVFVTSELGRFSTVGGLGVMVDELTQGIVDLGSDVWIVTPYYNKNRKGQTDYLRSEPTITFWKTIEFHLGKTKYSVGVHYGVVSGVRLLFLHNEILWPSVYADKGTTAEKVETLAVFAYASLRAVVEKNIVPSVVVTNDWFTGLVPGYGKCRHFGDYFEGTTFFHIAHNLDPTYEGRIYPEASELSLLREIHQLPEESLIDPFWEKRILNPSRCAFYFSDSWGTVSPSYLSELLASSPLASLLTKCEAPFAFPNGIRVKDRWTKLSESVGTSHEEAKAKLQVKYFGEGALDPTVPLFSFVGRITSQKGVHLIVHSVDELVHATNGRIQIIVGGPVTWSDSYSAYCGRKMRELKQRYPRQFWADPDAFFLDGPLVNLGSDFGVMPSAFEPGGIVQHEFYLCGTPVIVHRTGGLKDTVQEFDPVEGTGSGFLFETYTHDAFNSAMRRALKVYSKPDVYNELRQNASMMTIDVTRVSWEWYSEFLRLRDLMYIDGNVLAEQRLSLQQKSEILNGFPDLLRGGVVTELDWNASDREEPASAPLPSRICVRGSWDDWVFDWPMVPHPSDPSRRRVLFLTLPSGRYEYKFQVDGVWSLLKGREVCSNRKNHVLYVTAQKPVVA
eukprot:Rmarinus@m.30150